MQYRSLLSAVLVGLAFTGEVVAQRQDRGGRNGGGFRDTKTSAVASAASSTAAAANTVQTPTATTNKGANGSGGNGGNNGNNKGNGQNVLALNPAAVQTGSQQDGTKASGSQAGQAASATDAANFINFCVGKTLTNGLQNKAGSCNGIVMGDIPASTNMVSTVITFPENGADIEPNTTFNLTSTTLNMVFGSFTNAQATYYNAPQQLDAKTGNIIGHQHFSVQAMTAANVKKPLDPVKFAFFKGVNDAGDNRGDLQATVTGGLDAGTYRVCTMTSSSNHQPVLMAVAQRGPQDDCIRFTVGKGQGNAAGNNGAGNGNAGAATGTNTGGSKGSSAVSSAATATKSAAATGGNTAGKGSATGGNTGKTVTNKGSTGKGNTGKGKTNCNKNKNQKRAIYKSW